MSKKSKKKLKKKERQTLLKSTVNSRKSGKPAKKASTKISASRNGHAEAKAKKGKLVYYFGDGRSDGDGKMKALLGGKGANLAEMTRIGLPVPPGFTITTEVCTSYNEHGKMLPKELDGQVHDAITRIEKSLGKGFGSLSNPLLFAVRSGARDSMPGMMDTILNLGLNDETIQGLIAASANERFAWDCYRRFIQMYGDVVMGVQKRADEHHEPFETVISQLKSEIFPHRPLKEITDTELDTSSLRELVNRFKNLVLERTGKNFPSDPYEQLRGAIGAVFGSWMNERAIVYRQKYNIPTEWGTAVNVQSMVFGNTGENSCSGVAFTRDPATGEHVFYGEYLINAQGEDVVAGVRTPDPVATLQEKMPRAHKELEDVRTSLGKALPRDAGLRVHGGKRQALHAPDPQWQAHRRRRRTHRGRDGEGKVDHLAGGGRPRSRRPAQPAPHADLRPQGDQGRGNDRGRPSRRSRRGHGPYILPGERSRGRGGQWQGAARARGDFAEDIRGMLAAEGILTARGGVSSHAALVARQMGKVCVCGAHALHIDYHKNTLTVGDRVFNKGDYLSIDGTSGEVYAGEVKTAPSEIVQVLIDKSLDAKESPTYGMYAQLMGWADKLAACKSAQRRST